jgi:hypothetical protein
MERPEMDGMVKEFLQNVKEAKEDDVKILWCKNCERVTGFVIGTADDLVNGTGLDKNDLCCVFCGDNAAMMTNIRVLASWL